MKDSSPLSSRKFSEKMHFQAIHSEPPEARSEPPPPLAEAPPPQPLSEQSKSQTEMQFVNEEDVEALGAAAPPLPATEEPKALSALAASKTDSPSRKKGADEAASRPFCARGRCKLRSCLQSSEHGPVTSVLFGPCPFAEYVSEENLVVDSET